MQLMDEPVTVSGVLIEPGVESFGLSGREKVYSHQVLEEGAKMSPDTVPIHEKPRGNPIGETTKVSYNPDRGLVFEGKIHDDKIINKINDEGVTVAPALTEKCDDQGNPEEIITQYLFTTARPTDAVGQTEVIDEDVKLSSYLDQR